MENEEVLETQDGQENTQNANVEKSMDDTIRETLKAIQERDQEPEEVTESRIRDEKGKFAKKDTAPQEAEPSETAEPVTIPPDIQKLGLRKEEAEAFLKADKSVRDAFTRRSDEMHKGLEQYRTKAAFGDEMERAVSPYMQTIQGLGATPAQAVQKLLGADHALRYGTPQQKQQMLSQIARDYGIALEGVEQPAIDPNISTLQQQFQQMQGWIQNQTTQAQQREIQSLESEVNSFAQDKEHMDKVTNEMEALLPSIVRDNPNLSIREKLQKAYDMACYANADVRSQIIAKQQAESDAAKKAEAAKKVQDARHASAVNVARKGKLAAAKPVGTMDDTIRETAQRLGIL